MIGGQARSCGCLAQRVNPFPRKNKFNNIRGLKYNKLTAIEFDKRVKKVTFWKFLCDCGKIKSIVSSKVISGDIKSCSCSKKRKPRLSKEKSTFNSLYSAYKRKAKKREIFFDLSMDDFLKLVKSNCDYCNEIPLQKHSKFFLYNGIDRVNNKKGYITSNCVACCKRCNRAKDIMDTKEFFHWVRKVYENNIVS